MSLCAASGTGYKGFFDPPTQLARAGDNERPSQRGAAPSLGTSHLGGTMKNPLDSLWGTVIAGLALTVVLYAIAKIAMGG